MTDERKNCSEVIAVLEKDDGSKVVIIGEPKISRPQDPLLLEYSRLSELSPLVMPDIDDKPFYKRFDKRRGKRKPGRNR